MDEVAAEHAGAEAVLHYGPACLSPCGKLPVLHIFGQQPLDIGRCAEAFRELYPDRQSRVVVLNDVVYAHAMGECSGAGRGSLAVLRALQSCQGDRQQQAVSPQP